MIKDKKLNDAKKCIRSELKNRSLKSLQDMKKDVMTHALETSSIQEQEEYDDDDDDDLDSQEEGIVGRAAGIATKVGVFGAAKKIKDRWGKSGAEAKRDRMRKRRDRKDRKTQAKQDIRDMRKKRS